jgi:hypothetical protein
MVIQPVTSRYTDCAVSAILILSPHLHHSLPSGIFPSDFPVRTMHSSLPCLSVPLHFVLPIMFRFTRSPSVNLVLLNHAVNSSVHYRLCNGIAVGCIQEVLASNPDQDIGYPHQALYLFSWVLIACSRWFLARRFFYPED